MMPASSRPKDGDLTTRVTLKAGHLRTYSSFFCVARSSLAFSICGNSTKRQVAGQSLLRAACPKPRTARKTGKLLRPSLNHLQHPRLDGQRTPPTPCKRLGYS